MEFDFNKKGKQTVANSAESSELNKAKVEKTPADVKESIDNTSKATENNKETDKKASARKAVVSYIGNGTWKDIKGERWSRNDTRSYDENEYEEREDIKFMVKYGEMKVSLV